MKLVDIANAHNSINNLNAREDISAKLAYWMTKLYIKTQDDADFYAGEIQKLLDKYGDKQEGGGYKIRDEHLEDFKAATKAIDDMDAEDPGVRLPLSELTSGLKLSMQQIYPLVNFIDEDK